MSKSSKSKGKVPSKRQAPSSELGGDAAQDTDEFSPSQPGYMTVGSGLSQHAAHLQFLLGSDSGYCGSSSATNDCNNSTISPSAFTRGESYHTSNESGRRFQTGTIFQLWYNQHRVALGKSITQVVELLKGLQSINTSWPAHYPTLQRPSPFNGTRNSRTNVQSGLQRAHTTIEEVVNTSSFTSARSCYGEGPILRRSHTGFDDYCSAESSKAAEIRSPIIEPRLVTPQIAHEFSVLKLDLKLDGLYQAQLVHSLEKGSVASLLDEKIRSSINHLFALRERIEDTSSKVLVTGDLNAGKSTFCNALLRRKLLPEDQQPCTSIFCEVLDAGENSGIEEVHAVHLGDVYNRNDESTYDVFSLQELEKIVVNNTTYMQCKVYIKDVRTIDESLLNNGIVDIALIDAPGLNSDTTKTTAVFARQEEIDVVVFVVSATNHFTLTATEFIRTAAAEKAYFFFVVNGFDVIQDRNRCQKMILDQVSSLSPQTHKEAAELVHFVSSNAIPMSYYPASRTDKAESRGTGLDGGGPDNDPHDSPSEKGKGKENQRDFEEMEQSLRRFVVEKRAQSKLAPAKNYLVNILNDVNALAIVNKEVAQSEISRVGIELREIEPLLESSKRAKAEIATETEDIIEKACREIYDQTRTAISSSIAHSGDANPGVPYPGLLSAFQYAEDIKQVMLSRISASVAESEEAARVRASSGVNTLKQLGIMHLGNEFSDLNFRPGCMFRRRKDELARQINIPVEFWDFIDIQTLIQRQEKVAGTGMALTFATALGSRVIWGQSWMDHAFSAAKVFGFGNTRRVLVPGILAAIIVAASFVLVQIPYSLPRRLSSKISTQLAALDYVHNNSNRIAITVRKVLRFPADSLREGLNRSIEQLGTRKEETLQTRSESEVALKYFGNLITDSAKYLDIVGAVDLEASPAGTIH